MTENNFDWMENIAQNVRENVIRMSTNGGCFLGASLSCVDILVYLYTKYLNINRDNLNDPNRDYLLLSKGHDVPALYSLFAEINFIQKSRLKNHLKPNDFIYWHPNRNVNGIEFHSGSLGHLLSVGAGIAYDCKQKKIKNKVVVILGDGELNEGTVWESALISAAYKLNNLIAVIDRNQFQANERTERLIPLEPLEKKFEAFGWSVVTCYGHNFSYMDEAFKGISFEKDRPSAVIADTIRGKGLPSIEERADRWFCNFTEKEVNDLVEELRTNVKAELESKTLLVRKL